MMDADTGNADGIDAWREVHRHLTLAISAAQDGIVAEKSKRRFLLEEICANVTAEGKLTQNSSWKEQVTLSMLKPKKSSSSSPPSNTPLNRTDASASRSKARADGKKPPKKKKKGEVSPGQDSKGTHSSHGSKKKKKSTKKSSTPIGDAEPPKKKKKKAHSASPPPDDAAPERSETPDDTAVDTKAQQESDDDPYDEQDLIGQYQWEGQQPQQQQSTQKHISEEGEAQYQRQSQFEDAVPTNAVVGHQHSALAHYDHQQPQPQVGVDYQSSAVSQGRGGSVVSLSGWNEVHGHQPHIYPMMGAFQNSIHQQHQADQIRLIQQHQQRQALQVPENQYQSFLAQQVHHQLHSQEAYHGYPGTKPPANSQKDP